jgi:hypothetical protein
VGFVVEKVALGQVFSEFFGFTLPVSFRRSSPNSYMIWGTNNRPGGDRTSESSANTMDMKNHSI